MNILQLKNVSAFALQEGLSPDTPVILSSSDDESHRIKELTEVEFVKAFYQSDNYPKMCLFIKKGEALLLSNSGVNEHIIDVKAEFHVTDSIDVLTY
ncbi:hypothetical protein ABLA30_03865 [Xenorhabdus nematophila]|uniref:hypothetical protein n=1 Tax=Xenorhabdus nematophila TaxID=628 RepID=UPI0032B7755A